MLRMIVGWIGVALVGAASFQAAKVQPSSPVSPPASFQAARVQPSSPVPPPASPQRALLDRYCVTCHNETLRTAELMLDKMDVENVSEGAAVWENVLLKLRTGAMPPAGMPRPDKPTTDSFVAWLEAELGGPDTAEPNPGRPAIHRLNRAEYTNAIRDLLAIDIDGGSLLPPTILATVLITLGMSSRYRRCCWKDTCQQHGRSVASPLEIPLRVRS